MDLDTSSPDIGACFAALREAGLSGAPKREAVALAESLLDKEWEARGLAEANLDDADLQWWGGRGAHEALMASYREGLRARVRRAVERCVVHRPALEMEHFLEVAAQAAELAAEEIVAIVRDYCPIRHEGFALAYTGVELRTWHAPALIHYQFLKRYAGSEDGECEAWNLELMEESRAFFMAADDDLADDTTPIPEPEVLRAEALAASGTKPEAMVAAAKPTFDLENEPGLLGDIARFSQTYAFRPVREFAQPAAIAVGGAIFGRSWTTPTGLGLNLYQVAIAETGGGKDALLAAPKALLAKAGFRHLIGPGDFSSDAALETSLRMHPSQLMPLDEFGKLVQAMMGRNAPAFAKLAAKALLEIYPRSQPGSEWSGKQRADPARDNAAEPVHAPTLSILGVSTPEGFFEGMSQQTLEDGFLNRLTVIRAGPAGARQRDPARMEPPTDLIQRLQEAYAASAPAGDLAEAKARSANVEPEFRNARWADEAALAALEEVEAWEDAAVDAGRRGVCGRAAEQTQKIATIRALFRNPADPAVTAEDMWWAFAMVKASIEAIEDGARAMMAGSDFEALCNAILTAVTRAGPNGLPMSHLVRAKGVSKAHQRDVESALQRLQIAEQIHVDLGSTTAGSRPTKRVRPRFNDGDLHNA